MRQTLLRSTLFATAALATLAGCPDDGATPASDTAGGDTTAPAGSPFVFGVDPGQTIFAAPFPNDLYLTGDGIALAPLADDPTFRGLVNEAPGQRWDALIAERRGFGIATPILFPMSEAPDLASFDGRVHLITLDGPEAGRRLAARTYWHAISGTLGVMVDFGDYQVPGSRYAVLIEDGVRTEAGAAITSPAPFPAMLAAVAPSDVSLQAAYAVWEPVRNLLAAEADLAALTWVIGSVYTTEDTLAYGRKVKATVDGWTLSPPTRRLRYDTDSSAYVVAPAYTDENITDLMGTATGDFATDPTAWTGGGRDDAAALAGSRYEGGSLHHEFWQVVHGTFATPALHYRIADGKVTSASHQLDADGQPIAAVTELVAFTLVLCDGHRVGGDVPVAIAVHGGTASRTDMMAYANANCLAGVATLSYDLPFHGGRILSTYVAGDDVVASAWPDELNTYTGLSSSDAGFVPDGVGDNGGVTDTAGQLYALPFGVDADIVAANTMQVSIDAMILARHVAESDWSQVVPGLTFDADHIFLQGLSFGSTYATMAMALSDDWRGIVSSVGTMRVAGTNLPTAPSNSPSAVGFMGAVFGLKTPPAGLVEAAWRDPAVSMLQWLTQRGDSSGYAPFVLRHRQGTVPQSVLSSGDSWDETLHSPSQLSYNAAVGTPAYTAGADWTLDARIPGSEWVGAEAWPGGEVSANAAYNGVDHSAAIFYYAKTCHTEIINSVCVQRHAQPYPPVTTQDPVVSRGPLCALQNQIKTFLESLLTGDGVATLVAPSGTCDEVYGQ